MSQIARAILKRLETEDVRSARKTTSRELLETAKGPLECLRARGIEVTHWGSAARDMAQPSSDVDVYVPPTTKESDLRDCGFTLKASRDDNCGLFDKFTHGSANPRIDLTRRSECEWRRRPKWSYDYEVDDELKDILWLINRYYLERPSNKTYDHSECPDLNPFSAVTGHIDIKSREQSFPPRIPTPGLSGHPSRTLNPVKVH